MSTPLSLHRKLRGKIEIRGKIGIKSEKILSKVYTPGVAQVAKAIARDKRSSFDLTNRGNSVAIVTDGSRVLGLGNIGPEAAMPVMEGKAMIFKEFGNVDAYPICLKTQDEDEIVELVKNISPSFGAINVEDISSPKSLSIVDRLSKELSIPVFHDDQHGTAIVVLAALINALKVVKKKIGKIKVVIAGAGAAGYGITHILVEAGVKEILVVDSVGILYSGRTDGMNSYKKVMARKTNKRRVKGGLQDALRDADVFIGVSGKKGLLKGKLIREMRKKPIIFAISNPDSEILPSEARRFGAKVVATGMSDFPNQINNSLVFPGFLRGVLDSGKRRVDERMFVKSARLIARHVKPRRDRIIPSMFDKKLCRSIAKAVKNESR